MIDAMSLSLTSDSDTNNYICNAESAQAQGYLVTRTIVDCDNISNCSLALNFLNFCWESIFDIVKHLILPFSLIEDA